MTSSGADCRTSLNRRQSRSCALVRLRLNGSRHARAKGAKTRISGSPSPTAPTRKLAQSRSFALDRHHTRSASARQFGARRPLGAPGGSAVHLRASQRTNSAGSSGCSASHMVGRRCACSARRAIGTVGYSIACRTWSSDAATQTVRRMSRSASPSSTARIRAAKAVTSCPASPNR